jgi:hypothetical protein
MKHSDKTAAKAAAPEGAETPRATNTSRSALKSDDMPLGRVLFNRALYTIPMLFGSFLAATLWLWPNVPHYWVIPALAIIALSGTLFSALTTLKYAVRLGARARGAIRMADLAELVLALAAMGLLRTLPVSLWETFGVFSVLTIVAIPAVVCSAWFELTLG